MASNKIKGDEFPADFIYAILSRLPIKSLARFRCVCKSWLKYINDPYLETILHVKEEPKPLMFQQAPSSFYSIQHCKISFLHAIQGTNTVKQEHVLDFCHMGWYYRTRMRSDHLVLGSCNGLVLVCFRKLFYVFGILLILINPLSKQCFNLPCIKITSSYNGWGPGEAAGFGFDDYNNRVATVCVVFKELDDDNRELCTMVHYSGMSSWRRIAQIPAYPIRGEGIFAHGRLHWLAYCNDGRKIVWFDLKMEKFGSTDTPDPKEGGMDIEDDQLVDLNGEVGIVYMYNGIHVELWILKAEEWVLRCGFDLGLNPPPDNVKVSGCWNKDGDILLTSDGGTRLFVYGPKTSDSKEVDRDDGCEADIRMYQSSLFDACAYYSNRN